MADWYKMLADPPIEKPKKDAGVDWYNKLKDDKTFNPSWGDKQDKFGEPLVERPRPIDPIDKPSMGTSFKAGMMEDPKKKMETYAKARFPDVPIEESMKRYGVVDGDIVFVGDNGFLEKETGAISRFMGEQGLPISGAIAGGAVGGITGSIAGGSIGLAARKLGAQSMGDAQTMAGNAIDFAVEGVLNGIGWGAGKGVGGVIDRKVVRDISQFDKKIAQQLIEKGKTLGIDVTPAEASGLGSLISQQTRLGMGFDEAGDMFRKFYQKRVGDVDAAINKEIGATPPSSVAGKEIRDASGKIIRSAQDARTEAVRPLYDKALDSGVAPMNEALEKLQGSSTMRGAMSKAFSILDDDIALGRADAKLREYFVPVKEYSKGGRETGESLKLVKEPTLRVWDYVKRGLDSVINDGTDPITKKMNSGAERAFQLKKSLLEQIDSINPDYKAARKLYSDMSPEIEGMQKGMLGVLSNVKDPALLKASEKVFNAANIDATGVLSLKNQFTKAGYGKEWDEFLNSFLRKQWEGIKPTQAGGEFGSGAKFKQAVFGSKRQQGIMRAAMGGSRFQSFKDLMEVLEATGKVPKSQSMTEPAMQAGKAELYEAAPIVSKLGSSPLSPLRLREWWLDTQSRDWRATMAKIVTSPDAIKELEKLRKLKSLSPTNNAALGIIGNALTKAGVYSAAGAVGLDAGSSISAPKDIDPRVLRDLQR